MESATTKERILSEALIQFAERGYEAVSVEQIARAVGIKAPSLYKHYASKRDIFDAILAEMIVRYEKQVVSMNMSGNNPEQDSNMISSVGQNQLIKMAKQLFSYFLHDEFISKFRKMLTIEKYHNRELSALYERQYIDEPLAYQCKIFEVLIENCGLTVDNPQIMALHFYSPMFLLLTLCDCYPEKEGYAIDMVEQHVKNFTQLYFKNCK